jgi:hypothetical protein
VQNCTISTLYLLGVGGREYEIEGERVLGPKLSGVGGREYVFIEA